jgi:hypothetical protein
MYNEIFQMIEEEFYRINDVQAYNTFSKEGDYVYIQTAGFDGVDVGVNRLYIYSAKFGFDSKGNVKIETYNINESQEFTEKTSVIGSISYGAKFVDRDTTGIEER